MNVDEGMIAGYYEGLFTAVKMFVASGVFLFIILFIVLSLLLQWKVPVMKGWLGEWGIKRRLKKLPPDFKVFHDLFIPNGDGGLTQVDHIVASIYGIFVIETKRYNGWILGDEFQQNWTQVIYRKKTKMLNPIRQNYGHVQALSAYIGREGTSDIHSIIAFSSSSTFKFKKEFKTAQVIHFPELLQAILQHREKSISEAELKDICKKIEQLIVTDKKEKIGLKKKHRDTIRNATGSRQGKSRNSVAKAVSTITSAASSKTKDCPKCGEAMALKAGRYGKFYGCSGFPVCRYSEKG